MTDNIYMYLQGTHTYTTDALRMLLDHILQGHVGGRRWPGDDAMYIYDTIISVLTVALYTCLWYNLDPELE